jgi:hypothetical protein
MGVRGVTPFLTTLQFAIDVIEQIRTQTSPNTV